MRIKKVSKIRTWANWLISVTAILAILQYLETPHLRLLNTCADTSPSDVLSFNGDYFLFLIKGFLLLGKVAIQSLSGMSHLGSSDIAQDLCKSPVLIVVTWLLWILTIRLFSNLAIYTIRAAKPAPLDIISKSNYSLKPSISVLFSKKLPIATLELGYRARGFIGPVQRLRAHFALLLFFNAYPANSLEAKLSRVFFCRYLLCHERRIGGMAYAKRREIYVSLSNKKQIADLVKTLHHEFAHLCAKSPNFERDFRKPEWMRTHENQRFFYPFERQGGGPAAIQQGLSGSKPTNELLQLGYLHQYGSTCFEEDFCSYVDHMFAYPKRLVSLQVNPLVQKKTKMVYDYYVELGAKIPTEVHDLWR